MNRVASAVFFLLASSPLLAFAQEEDPPPLTLDTAGIPAEAPALPPPLPPRYDLWRVNAGVEVSYLTGRGYDAYSTNDALTNFSLDATYPLLTRGNVTLAAGLAWKFGGSDADLRGVSTELRSHRFLVPIEARWHPGSALFLFVKAAPGARLSVVNIEDVSSAASLSDSAWSFATDLSVGTSILLGPGRKFEKRRPKLWVTPELGYGLTTSASLAPNPGRDPDDVLGSDASTNVRGLALNGFFWRASMGMTF